MGGLAKKIGLVCRDPIDEHLPLRIRLPESLEMGSVTFQATESQLLHALHQARLQQLLFGGSQVNSRPLENRLLKKLEVYVVVGILRLDQRHLDILETNIAV